MMQVVPCLSIWATRQLKIRFMELTEQPCKKQQPYLPNSIDIMAVGNLPNELPRDASSYFGEQLIKHVLGRLGGKGSPIIERATMVRDGKLTPHYEYLKDYADGELIVEIS